MSIQDDGVTLKIDHGENTTINPSYGGRGSYMTPQIKPALSPVQKVPGRKVISQQNNIVALQPPNNAAIQAIYASGDQAKIAAWEKFVALKEQGDQALISQDQTGSLGGSSLQLDHGAARITDKAMLVDTNVRAHQSSPLGSQDPGSFTRDQ